MKHIYRKQSAAQVADILIDCGARNMSVCMFRYAVDYSQRHSTPAPWCRKLETATHIIRYASTDGQRYRVVVSDKLSA